MSWLSDISRTAAQAASSTAPKGAGAYSGVFESLFRWLLNQDSGANESAGKRRNDAA